MGDLLHYEDFPAGEVIVYGAYEVTADEIKAFAGEFDPQPFHLDEEAGRASILGGLCASGWHVCAMLNRMNVDAYLVRSAAMGSFGLEEVKWLRPVFAGSDRCDDRLDIDAAARPGALRLYHGPVVRVRCEAVRGFRSPLPTLLARFVLAG